MFNARKIGKRLAIFGICCGAVLLAFRTPSLAQDEFAQTHSMCGWIPVELLTRPVPLRTGIGTIHEEVSTSSKQAQAFYDQGLAYLQSYFWIEAARSFHQALRYDPRLVLAYVGLSYAYSPIDFAAARTELNQAEQLVGHATDRERRRIEIRALQMKAMSDTGKIENELAFRDALDDALSAYPNDVIFLLLRGTAQDPSPFADGQGCVMEGAPFYERALAADPGNFAAEHFLTHCDENAGRIQEALPHALAYAAAAPDIPHAQHMCGHVLRRAGRMEEAIARFQRADELERAYFKAENISPSIDWHYSHNLNLLASSYQYLGEMKNAEKYFRQSGAVTAYTDYDSFNRKDWPEFLLNRKRFPEALTAARAMTQKPSPLARAVGYVLAGESLLSMNRPKEAAAELDRADQIVKTLTPADVPSLLGYIEGLQGALSLENGDAAHAGERFHRVILRIRAANGPDSWTQGLYQLGFWFENARRVNDWALAGQFAQEMSQRAPDYAGSHYALAVVADHNKDSETAAREFSAAVKLWAQADPDLPELSEAKRALSTHNP
jgi:tetratricopeptide (TPR) repeat protein